MKYQSPFRPGPQPSSEHQLSLAFFLFLPVGLAMCLCFVYQEGRISEELFTAGIFFASAMAIGLLLGADSVRHRHKQAREHSREVLPPADFVSVWPPHSDRVTPPARRPDDRRPPSSRTGGRRRSK